MLLPKGGVTWKSAKARFPPWRALIVYITKVRFLAAVAFTGLIILLWRGISVSTKDLSKSVSPSLNPDFLLEEAHLADGRNPIAVIIASALRKHRQR
jgi:hypothetical protein